MIRIQIQCIWIHNTGIESEFILLRNSKYFYGAVAVSSGPGLLPAEPGSVPELSAPPVQPARHAAHRCQHLPLPSQPGIHNNNINNPFFYNFAKTCANVVQCWGAKLPVFFFGSGSTFLSYFGSGSTFLSYFGSRSNNPTPALPGYCHFKFFF